VAMALNHESTDAGEAEMLGMEAGGQVVVDWVAVDDRRLSGGMMKTWVGKENAGFVDG